jgi:hypothetical protein
MSLSVDHLSPALPGLLPDPVLLLADPRQSGNNGKPNRFLVESLWGSYSDPTERRIDGEVEILDVFANDINLKA